ncbi:hypothetical protein BH11PSE12_BH11PSE12_09100 [soil metagenome]
MRRYRLPIQYSTAKCLLWILLPALLLTQWVGMAHRISHASSATGSSIYRLSNTSYVANFPFGDDNRLHSCAAFDAATLAECLHSAPLLMAPPASIRPGILLASNKIWLASPPRYFASRAPPQHS